MNKKKAKQITKQAAIKSLTVAGKIVIGMFEFFGDMEFMRRHQSLCMSMDLEEAKAYIAETEAYRKEYRHAFRRLKKRGWVEERKIGGRMMAVLTGSGEVAALEIKLKKLVPELKENEYWMVTFDFPEVAHAARDEFRGFLKRVGFVYHQKSNWCSKKDVGKGITKIVKILGIRKWIRIYRLVEYT